MADQYFSKYTGAKIDEAVEKSLIASEDVAMLQNKAANIQKDIAILQHEVDELSVFVLERIAKGWPVASPNGVIYGIYVNDDGTLYTRVMSEEELSR